MNISSNIFKYLFLAVAALLISSCYKNIEEALKPCGQEGSACCGNNVCGNGMLCSKGICVAETFKESSKTEQKAVKVIHYVKWDASGSNSGIGWNNAFTDLQTALKNASEDDEIWVAAGTYYPASDDDRYSSFDLVEGVSVYGCFDGSENSLDERDCDNNETVLSGDIGIPNEISDNSYHVVTGADNAVLDGFTISYGNADGKTINSMFGGGMLNNNTNPEVSNCVFKHNFAVYGGAMFNFKNRGYVSKSVFKNNRSQKEGGAIFNYSNDMNIIDCEFENNSSFKGGAVFNKKSNAVFSNTVFIVNTVEKFGGAVYNEGGNPSFNGCIFRKNSVSQKKIAIIGGGAVSNYKSSPVFNSSIFEQNGALYGGAFFNNYSSPEITDSVFKNNTAIKNGGAIENRKSSPMIVRSRFVENFSSNGGAISNRRSSPLVEKGHFEKNFAEYSGGAIYNFRSSPTIGESVFENNNTGTKGKGGAVANLKSDPDIVNSIFFGNSSELGGAISNRDSSSPRISSSTVADNKANKKGGGMHNAGFSCPVVSNSIFWGNSAGSKKQQIFDQQKSPGRSFSKVTYSNVEGGLKGAGNISVDPFFQDISRGELSLNPDSPCINKGNRTLKPVIETDIDGNKRVVDGEIDMGPYEYQ